MALSWIKKKCYARDFIQFTHRVNNYTVEKLGFDQCIMHISIGPECKSRNILIIPAETMKKPGLAHPNLLHYC